MAIPGPITPSIDHSASISSKKNRCTSSEVSVVDARPVVLSSLAQPQPRVPQGDTNPPTASIDVGRSNDMVRESTAINFAVEESGSARIVDPFLNRFTRFLALEYSEVNGHRSFQGLTFTIGAGAVIGGAGWVSSYAPAIRPLRPIGADAAVATQHLVSYRWRSAFSRKESH